MAPLVNQQEQQSVRIPAWVVDLTSFRRWATSDDFPRRGWYAYLDGDVWVDLSIERLRHNQIKTEFSVVLGGLARTGGAGRFFVDRMLLTNTEAGLSTEPDGMFVSYESLRQGRVRLEQGEESLEVEGSPDMALEVVSPNSVQKDTMILRELYWRAGVKEYWLCDPRGGNVAFDILRHGPKGYSPARRQGGWLKSAVFGKSFRLAHGADPLGEPVYTLAVR